MRREGVQGGRTVWSTDTPKVQLSAKRGETSPFDNPTGEYQFVKCAMMYMVFWGIGGLTNRVPILSNEPHSTYLGLVKVVFLPWAIFSFAMGDTPWTVICFPETGFGVYSVMGLEAR